MQLVEDTLRLMTTISIDQPSIECRVLWFGKMQQETLPDHMNSISHETSGKLMRMDPKYSGALRMYRVISRISPHNQCLVA